MRTASCRGAQVINPESVPDSLSHYPGCRVVHPVLFLKKLKIRQKINCKQQQKTIKTNNNWCRQSNLGCRSSARTAQASMADPIASTTLMCRRATAGAGLAQSTHADASHSPSCANEAHQPPGPVVCNLAGALGTRPRRLSPTSVIASSPELGISYGPSSLPNPCAKQAAMLAAPQEPTVMFSVDDPNVNAFQIYQVYHELQALGSKAPHPAC